MQTLELRDYQKKAVAIAISKLRNKGSSHMIQAPTGSGKSEMFIEVVRRLVDAEEVDRVLIVTPRRVLIEQTVKRFVGYGLRAAELKDEKTLSLEWSEDTPILVAHQSSSYNRLGLMDVRNILLVIDEAHSAATNGQGLYGSGENQVTRLAKTILVNGGRVLGVTATPWRLSDSDGFDGLFRSMHTCPSYEELAKRGYVVPLRVVDKQTIRTDGVRTQNGEYVASDVWDSNPIEKLINEPLSLAIQMKFFTPELPALIFCATREHAFNVAMELKATHKVAVGINFTYTEEFENSGDGIDFLGRDAHDAFSDGRINAIVTVFKYLEGVDIPRAKAIVDLAPTKSQSRWRQKAGRVSRPYGEATEAVLLDAVGNRRRLGSPTASYEWSLVSRDSEELQRFRDEDAKRAQHELAEERKSQENLRKQNNILQRKLDGYRLDNERLTRELGRVAKPEKKPKARAAPSPVRKVRELQSRKPAQAASLLWSKTRDGKKYRGKFVNTPRGWTGNGLISPIESKAGDISFGAMLFVSHLPDSSIKLGFFESVSEAQIVISKKLNSLLEGSFDVVADKVELHSWR